MCIYSYVCVYVCAFVCMSMHVLPLIIYTIVYTRAVANVRTYNLNHTSSIHT